METAGTEWKLLSGRWGGLRGKRDINISTNSFAPGSRSGDMKNEPSESGSHKRYSAGVTWKKVPENDENGVLGRCLNQWLRLRLVTCAPCQGVWE